MIEPHEIESLRVHVKKLESQIAVKDLRLENAQIEIDYLRSQLQKYMDRARQFLDKPLLSSPIDIEDVYRLDDDTKKLFIEAVKRQMADIQNSFKERKDVET